MKQCFHIFLALLIATTSAPSGQGVAFAFKMTAFVHHFMHHLLCHGEEIGIKDFVELHYSYDEHHEEDHQEHENLPFSHHHHQDQPAPAQHVLYLLPQMQAMLASLNAEIAANSLKIQEQQWYSSLFSSDIWQPPKA
jgi:hypothetical protein